MHATAPKIDSSIQQKIIAVVMYGDPGRTSQPFPGVLRSRVFENCAKGDFSWCLTLKPQKTEVLTKISFKCGNDGKQGNGHLSYRSGTFHRDSADFIAAAFNGNPKPARP